VCNSAAHNRRPGRESLRKRLGVESRRIDARDGYRCVYCGATAETAGAALQLDHLTPRAAGGGDEATNLVVACRRCNSARQNLPLRDWAAKAQVDFGLVFSARQIRAQARRRLPPLAECRARGGA
jgi:hypothetical protein